MLFLWLVLFPLPLPFLGFVDLDFGFAVLELVGNRVGLPGKLSFLPNGNEPDSELVGSTADEEAERAGATFTRLRETCCAVESIARHFPPEQVTELRGQHFQIKLANLHVALGEVFGSEAGKTQRALFNATALILERAFEAQVGQFSKDFANNSVKLARNFRAFVMGLTGSEDVERGVLSAQNNYMQAHEERSARLLRRLGRRFNFVAFLLALESRYLGEDRQVLLIMLESLGLQDSGRQPGPTRKKEEEKGGVEADKENLARLKEVLPGHDDEVLMKALLVTNNDFEQALNKVLNNQVEKDQVFGLLPKKKRRRTSAESDEEGKVLGAPAQSTSTG